MTTNVDFGQLQNLGLANTATGIETQSVGQDEYLTLMLAQFENQDPFEPLENGEFLAQLAQFSTASGIEELQESFATFSDRLISDQALQASALVGREVLVNSELGRSDIAGQSIGGALEFEGASGVIRVDVLDASGQLVRTLDLGTRTRGDTNWEWNGQLENGEPALPGIYQFRATVQRGSDVESVPTLLRSGVGSVTLDPTGQGITINSSLLGSFSFADVRQIF
ncbi:MAG: flagellar hook assembly protein FlgD [Pseudomonadota bacterium]